jgi:ABC-2 type transport system permease protein
MIVGALFVGLLIFLIRAQQPERLLNPRAIYDVAEFFSAFRTPSSPLLPSTWATEVMSAGRQGESFPAMPLALLWSSALATVVIGCWLARAIYHRGFSRSQESRPARLSSLPMVDRMLELTTRPFEPRLRALLLKDVKSFLRDTTQWSQLLLLLALVVIYLYNFSVLPSNFTYGTFFLQNLFAFLNLGLAGFVLSAVAVRFVFTSVSAEGPAFWIIRTSPLSLRRFLWSKFWTSLPPLLLLSQVLTLASNYFLGATRFMTILASVSILCVTFGIVGMGVGMGAMFPRFKFENVTQIAGSSGGLLYMIATTSFIAIVLFLEALPLYFYFAFRFRGEPNGSTVVLVTLLALTALIALNMAAVVIPMRLGRKRLAAMEF